MSMHQIFSGPLEVVANTWLMALSPEPVQQSTGQEHPACRARRFPQTALHVRGSDSAGASGTSGEIQGRNLEALPQLN